MMILINNYISPTILIYSNFLFCQNDKRSMDQIEKRIRKYRLVMSNYAKVSDFKKMEDYINHILEVQN